MICSWDMLIEEYFNLIGQEVQLATPNRKWCSPMLPLLDNYLHVRNLRYRFFPEILMIKESYHLIGQKTQLAVPNQKTVADATFSSREYLHAKNLRYWLILSRDIEDQRIPQSDWLIAFRTITEEPDFSYTCSFSRIIKSISCTIFRIKANKCILEEFLGFSPKMRTFLKNWAAPVFAF